MAQKSQEEVPQRRYKNRERATNSPAQGESYEPPTTSFNLMLNRRNAHCHTETKTVLSAACSPSSTSLLRALRNVRARQEKDKE